MEPWLVPQRSKQFQFHQFCLTGQIFCLCSDARSFERTLQRFQKYWRDPSTESQVGRMIHFSFSDCTDLSTTVEIPITDNSA